MTNLRTSPSFSENSNSSLPSEFFLDADALITDLSDNSWIDSSDDCSNVPIFTTANPEPKNHIHFGKDLSGYLDNSNDCHGMLSDFSDVTALKTTSVGIRKVFVIGNNNSLKVVTL